MEDAITDHFQINTLKILGYTDAGFRIQSSSNIFRCSNALPACYSEYFLSASEEAS
jgi:hypothetical protein